jgi:flagellar basal-body rod protein FlgB
MSALQSALRGLAARQRAIADNVSNLETPGFLAARVDFESSLREALAAGSPETTNVATSRSLAPTGVNGNNVNLDDETISAIQTNLRYQAALEGVNNKFRLIRTAIRG